MFTLDPLVVGPVGHQHMVDLHTLQIQTRLNQHVVTAIHFSVGIDRQPLTIKLRFLVARRANKSDDLGLVLRQLPRLPDQ